MRSEDAVKGQTGSAAASVGQLIRVHVTGCTASRSINTCDWLVFIWSILLLVQLWVTRRCLTHFLAQRSVSGPRPGGWPTARIQMNVLCFCCSCEESPPSDVSGETVHVCFDDSSGSERLDAVWSRPVEKLTCDLGAQYVTGSFTWFGTAVDRLPGTTQSSRRVKPVQTGADTYNAASSSLVFEWAG